MEKRLTLTQENALVILEMHKNLRVKGSDGQEVIAQTLNGGEITLEANAEGAYVSCDEDCSVHVPRKARLQVTVEGNAAFKSLEGELLLEAVHGNLELRGVGPTQVEVLHGNLEAKNVLGDLQIEKVEGNVQLRDVQGEFSAERIEGNLQLEDVDGGAAVNQVEGNASLRLDPSPGATYQIKTAGNLVCNLSADASVRIHILQAARVMVNLPGSEGKKHAVPFQLTLGDGDAEMTLAAEGNVLLAGQAPAWDAMPEPGFEFAGEFEGMAETISKQVTEQMQAQMDMMEQQLNSHLNNLAATMNVSGVSTEQAERIRRKAMEASQRAMERAQEKMNRSQERMERKMAAIHQRAAQRAAQHAAHQAAYERRAEEFRSRRPGPRPSFGFTPFTPPPAPEPVSDEERMVILKMLEQKQITVEQAEKLLAALEGNDS